MEKSLIILDYDGVMTYSFLSGLVEFFLEIKRCRMRMKNPIRFLRFINYKLVPGVDKAIKDLYEHGCVIAIVSSNKTRIIKRVLRKNNLEKYVSAIMGREQKISKDQKIAALLTRLPFRKHETFYVGDTVGDIEKSKKAGVKSVAGSWGYHRKKFLEVVSPDMLIDNPQELMEAILYK